MAGNPKYLGRGASVKIVPLPDGVEAEPTAYTLTIAGVYTQTITVDTAAAGAYGVTVSTVASTYTAAADDTAAEIAAGLAAAVNANASTSISAAYPGTGAVLTIYHTSTFTATLSGANSANMTLGTISSGTGAHPKGAGELRVTALPAGAYILSGTYHTLEAASGIQVLTQTRALVEGAATVIPVNATPAAIAASSTGGSPFTLKGRSTANLNRTGNRVTAASFDDGLYLSGLTSNINAEFALNGTWSPKNDGFRNAEYFFGEGLQQFWGILQLPNPDSSQYTTGPIYKGPISITGVPLDVPADNLITANITAAFNGKPILVDAA